MCRPSVADSGALCLRTRSSARPTSSSSSTSSMMWTHLDSFGIGRNASEWCRGFTPRNRSQTLLPGSLPTNSPGMLIESRSRKPSTSV